MQLSLILMHSLQLFILRGYILASFKIWLVEKVHILHSPACKHPTQAKILLGFRFTGNVNHNKTAFTVNFLSKLHCSQGCSLVTLRASLQFLSFIWLQLVKLIGKCDPAIIILFLYAGFSIWVEYSSAFTSRLSELLPSYKLSSQIYTIILLNSHFTILFVTRDVQARTHLSPSWKLVLISVWEYIFLMKNTLEARMFSKRLFLACYTLKLRICFFLKGFHKIHTYFGKQKIFLYVCENWLIAGRRNPI